MAASSRFILCGLAVLTLFLGVAELSLSAIGVFAIISNRNWYNSSKYGDDYFTTNSQEPAPDVYIGYYQFVQPWVPVRDGSVWAVPSAEVAAGAISTLLGLLLCVHSFTKIWPKRRFGSAGSPKTDRIVIILSSISALATTALFIYVFAAWGKSAMGSHVHIEKGFDNATWDTTPTWEVWTCAVSSYAAKHDITTPFKLIWRYECQMNMSARWTLLPVFIFSWLSVVALFVFRLRSTPGERAKTEPEEHNTEQMREEQ